MRGTLEQVLGLIACASLLRITSAELDHLAMCQAGPSWAVSTVPPSSKLVMFYLGTDLAGSSLCLSLDVLVAI
jgi:hypothetical protein